MLARGVMALRERVACDGGAAGSVASARPSKVEWVVEGDKGEVRFRDAMVAFKAANLTYEKDGKVRNPKSVVPRNYLGTPLLYYQQVRGRRFLMGRPLQAPGNAPKFGMHTSVTKRNLRRHGTRRLAMLAKADHAGKTHWRGQSPYLLPSFSHLRIVLC